MHAALAMGVRSVCAHDALARGVRSVWVHHALARGVRNANTVTSVTVHEAIVIRADAILRQARHVYVWDTKYIIAECTVNAFRYRDY